MNVTKRHALLCLGFCGIRTLVWLSWDLCFKGFYKAAVNHGHQNEEVADLKLTLLTAELALSVSVSLLNHRQAQVMPART